MLNFLRHLLLCLLIPATRAGAKEPRSAFTAAAKRRGLKTETAMRSFLLIAAIIAIASLGACTLFRTKVSWVDDLPSGDTANVARTVAALVADSLPPSGKPVALVAPPFTQSGNRFAAELKSALQALGYTVVEEDTAVKDVYRLRYLLTAYEGGYVLRVSLNDAETSTLLARGSSGQLVATAPLAVREASR